MPRRKNNPRNVNLDDLAKLAYEHKTAFATAQMEAKDFIERATYAVSHRLDQAVVEAYKQNVSIAEIARASGYSRQAIYGILTRTGHYGPIPNYIRDKENS